MFRHLSCPPWEGLKSVNTFAVLLLSWLHCLLGETRGDIPGSSVSCSVSRSCRLCPTGRVFPCSLGAELGLQASPIQVGTPSLGSTQICSTSHRPSRARTTRDSMTLPFLSM